MINLAKHPLAHLLNFASSNQIGSLKSSSVSDTSHGSDLVKPSNISFNMKSFAA
jgi:hypothetical protein